MQGGGTAAGWPRSVPAQGSLCGRRRRKRFGLGGEEQRVTRGRLLLSVTGLIFPSVACALPWERPRGIGSLPAADRW